MTLVLDSSNVLQVPATNASGNLSSAANLTVAGTSTLTGNVTTSGQVNVNSALIEGVSGTAVIGNGTAGNAALQIKPNGTGSLEIDAVSYNSVTTAHTLALQGNTSPTTIGGSLSVAGQTNITPNIASTSTTTGSLVLTGGLGVTGDIWVSGTVHASAFTLNDPITATHFISTDTTPNLQFGGNAASGFYADATNVSIRPTGTTGAIYFQSRSGSTSYGYINSGGINLLSGVYAGAGTNLTGVAASLSAGSLYTNAGVTTITYSGNAGQPAWLLGTNSGTNYQVWNPSNFSVATATNFTASGYSYSAPGRAFGTNYTNTTGRILHVCITVNSTASGIRGTSVYVNGVLVMSGASVSGSSVANFTVVVPPGGYYQVTTVGGQSLAVTEF